MRLVLTMLGSLTEIILRGMMLLAGFVTNSSTFPQPLGEEEEAKYLARLQDGDEGARAVLIERNLRLVAHIVKKFDNTGEDVDDLISIGTVGLIKAIGTFKPDKGTRLATYAARCIENEILMHLRSLKRVRGEVSLYDPIGVDREGNEITLVDYSKVPNRSRSRLPQDSWRRVGHVNQPHSHLTSPDQSGGGRWPDWLMSSRRGGATTSPRA